jgi:hypothetical protein
MHACLQTCEDADQDCIIGQMFAKSENTYLPIQGDPPPLRSRGSRGLEGGEVARAGGIGLEMVVNLKIV